MTIDDRFSVSITAKIAGEPQRCFEITASEFFDDIVTDEYTEDEWGTDLPWKKNSIVDYVDLSVDAQSKLLYVQVDILDKLSRKSRRLCEQRWQTNKVLCDWLGAEGRMQVSQLILDLKDSRSSCYQILKLDFSPGEMKIVSHSSYSPSQPDDVRCVDIFRLREN